MSNGTTCSTAWLDNNLGNVKILDGAFYLTAENRNAEAEFAAAHIIGAQRFNIDVICASDTNLPHMFPAPITFADAAELRKAFPKMWSTNFKHSYKE